MNPASILFIQSRYYFPLLLFSLNFINYTISVFLPVQIVPGLESDVRELCKDLLKPLGYTILLADSGSAGINIYRERQDDISLVILDMIMPKMGGREVFQALKTINPEVKVLLCSGFGQNGFAGIEDLLRKGAVEFVQKPFLRQTIGLAIKKALQEASGPLH